MQGLWKRFGSGKDTKTVVKDLYFGVEQGEVFGLLGPNGAGKTSSLKMITADFQPSQGKVRCLYYLTFSIVVVLFILQRGFLYAWFWGEGTGTM